VFIRIYICITSSHTRHRSEFVAIMTTSAEMKACVMETVHDLLRQSGQSVPAKHLSIGEHSLQVYDVEHWPESFNSLLLHDFPSLVLSIDSSCASLSGFVVTLHWKPAVDMSQFIAVVVHCLVLFLVVLFVTHACWVSFLGMSTDNLEQIRALYFLNGTTTGSGANGTRSVLNDDLRAAMAHVEL
jgi:hypothetical protein